MKIVLGFDDSPHAQAALRWMCEQAWPAGAKAIVVSAVRVPVTAYAEVYAPSVGFTQESLAELEQHSQEIVAAARTQLQSAGIAAEGRVLQGDPREVLVDVARAEGAGLVVVGSHGRTGFARLVLGSVAAHVVGHAPCSVMVVKRPGR